MRKGCSHGDFAEWLGKPANLRELSDEIGANWVLVRRFLSSFLAEHGFYICSEREIIGDKEATQ